VRKNTGSQEQQPNDEYESSDKEQYLQIRTLELPDQIEKVAERAAKQIAGRVKTKSDLKNIKE